MPPAPSPALRALHSLLPPEISACLAQAAEMRPRRGPGAGAEGLLPTGLPAVDTLLSGGLLRGVLVEVAGPCSSGRFSLALCTLAVATRRGEAAAFVDLGDHLDPHAAALQGVELPRLLWVRPRTPKEALSAAESVLAAGFRTLVMDLGIRILRGRIPDAAWLRLARMAFGHDAALLVLSPYRITGAAAGVVLAARARGRWQRLPGALHVLPHATLLAGLDARLTLEKEKNGARTSGAARPGATARLSLFSPDSIFEGQTPDADSGAGQVPAPTPAPRTSSASA